VWLSGVYAKAEVVSVRDVTIERAGSVRTEEVTAILSEGFMDDPVCAHLFPDDDGAAR
jgi:hypothetical protein